MPISYCPPLNNASILICILGFFITLVLYREQRKLVNTGSGTAVSTLIPHSQTSSLTPTVGKAAYLDTRNTSYGFEPTAIVHSLPQASFIWAFFLFAIQGFWMTFGTLPAHIFVPTISYVGAVLVLACCGVWVALHPREKSHEETPLPRASDLLPIDSKEFSTVDCMV